MKKKKVVLLVIVFLIAAGAAYYFYFSGAAAGKSSDAIKAISDQDQALYNTYKSIMQRYMPAGSMAWVMNDAYKRYQLNDVSPDYYIGGKLGKSSALIATWAAEYYGYGYDNISTDDEATMLKDMYDALYQVQAQGF